MSYTPHTWTDGEVITEQKMNNIENGVADAISKDDIIDTELIDEICSH